MNNVLITIPARSGSKGIYNKNMHPLAGKPLLFHTIDFATDYITGWYGCDIILTTDIAQGLIMQNENARLQNKHFYYHRRPDKLCTDKALAWDVWQEAAQSAATHFNKEYDIHVYLEPTSPNRRFKDLHKCLDLIWGSHIDYLCAGEKEVAGQVFYKINSVCTVSPSSLSPGKLFTINHSNNVGITINHNMMLSNAPRQSQGQYYTKNGVCYCCTAARMATSKTMIDEDTYLHVIDHPIVNIDTADDFTYAEALLNVGLS